MPYVFCYTGFAIQPLFLNSGGNPGPMCDDLIASMNETDEDGSSWTFTISNQTYGYYANANFCNASWGITALQSIVLPNGTSWKFLYDVGSPYTDPYYGQDATFYTESYGTVKEIFLPTGGTIDYSYANRYSALLDELANVNARIVTSRTEDDGLGNTINRTFSYSQSVNSLTTTETTSDGNIVHTFDGSHGIGIQQQIIETQVKYYQGQISGTPLKEVDTAYNAMPGGSISPILPANISTTTPAGVTSVVQRTYHSPFTLSAYWCDYDTGSANCSQAPSWDGYGVYTGPFTVYLDQVTQEDVLDGSGNYLQSIFTTPEYTVNSSFYSSNMLHLVASTQTTDGYGNVKAITTYGYDESGYFCSGTHGNQTSVNRWLNTASQYLTTHTTFDCHGMPTVVTDPKGYSTTTTYDGTGMFASQIQSPTTGSVQHIEYFNYDPYLGLLNFHVDQNGSSSTDNAHKTTYTYDVIGRPLSIVYPPTQNGTQTSSGSGETDYCYTDLGGSTCSTSSPPYSAYTSTLLTTGQRLQPTIQKYDGLGRLIRTTDSSGAMVDTTYDAEGRVLSVTNPYLSQSDETYGTTLYYYDVLGRKKLQVQPDGNQSEQSWVYSGNTITFTDEAGSQWQRTSDALGRLIKVLEPNGTSTTPSMETDYSYDPLGNLIGVSQWGGPYGSAGVVNRSFSYDSLSRLIQAHNPEAGWICYGTTPGRAPANGSNCTEGYDANGNLIAKTDARGIEIDYSYDALNRLTGKTYPNSSDTAISYSFDANSSSNFGKGLRTGMSDASGSTAWTYDAMGRVLTETETIGALSPKSIQNVYYLNGAVAQLVYPSGSVLQYTVSTQSGRTTALTDTTHSIQYASNAVYNAPGGLTGFNLGQSIAVTDHFQPRLQIASISATASGQTLLNLSYNYHYASGDNGDIYTITNGKDSTRSQSFLYDTVNRVSQASEGNRWGLTFSYDGLGNLKQTGDLPGVPNPMALSQTVNSSNQFTLGGFGYDGAGNVTADGTNIFNCQTNNSPSTYAWNAEGQIVCGTGATYTYNGNGERVKKSTGTLYWGGEAGAALAESDLSGNITSEYVFFGGKRVARRDANGSVYYFLSDHLGSSNVVTSATAQILNESDFYPFGGELVITQNLSNQHYKFTGKERDAETDNDYFGARYDRTSVGRFLSPDWSAKVEPVPYAKLADPQSLNLYSYVENNPLRTVDPDGHTGNGQSDSHSNCGDVQADSHCVKLDEKKSDLQNQTNQNKSSAQQKNPMDQVAMSAETAAIKPTRESVKNGDYHEYGGLILERDSDGRISSTKPIAGKERTVDVDSIHVPKGYTVVGEYHTHPHATAAEGQGPSPADIYRLRTPERASRVGYVVDSFSGVVYRYTQNEPVRGPYDTKVYGTPIGTIP